jgi:trigger factor
MPSFTDLAVSVDDVEVADAEVDEQLDGLRSRFGTLQSVERPVQQDDFVLLDLSATVNGEEIAELATTDLSYQVGSGELFEGIDEALIGASQGEQRTVTTSLATGEHAGQPAEVTVTVQAIKERELPAADDEFAQLASEFDTLEELRNDLRTRLERVKSVQQGAKAREEVLKALLAATEIPLPEAIVDSEYESRKHDALHSFEHDEQRLGRWLEQQGHTAEEFDNDLRNSARETVKAHLLLDAIADNEELSVSDSELSERIVYQAHRRGVSPTDYAQQAHQSGELGAIYADIRRGKALAAVARQATVTDASGNSLDIEALLSAASQR